MENDELSINPVENTALLDCVNFIASELHTTLPKDNGGMRASVSVVRIDKDTYDIVIAVDYASYVNDLPMIGGTRAGTITKHPKPPHANRNYHCVQKIVDRAMRAYAQDHVDNMSELTGIDYKVIKGVKGE